MNREMLLTLCFRLRSLGVVLVAATVFVLVFGCKSFEKGNRHARGASVQVSKDLTNFVFADSGIPFVPFGFNYDRDYKMRLIEEYWESEWPTVVEDFLEMKQLGANVVRVHLQFAKFMETADKPNKTALAQLSRLVRLAEENELYLDVTGLGCYRKADLPAWFNGLPEKERWLAQAKFWEAIAKTCANSPAIFCYNLMNEPVVPGGKLDDWLVGELAGFYYVQAITLDANGRKRSEIAREWIATLTTAIRQQDKNHLITVGLLPNEPFGFVHEIAPCLDFISVHIYPRSGELAKDLKTLEKFSTGKPLVVEEIFPIACTSSELLQFIEHSKERVQGWISFYWGKNPGEPTASETISDTIARNWLNVFRTLSFVTPSAPAAAGNHLSKP